MPRCSVSRENEGEIRLLVLDHELAHGVRGHEPELDVFAGEAHQRELALDDVRHAEVEEDLLGLHQREAKGARREAETEGAKRRLAVEGVLDAGDHAVDTPELVAAQREDQIGLGADEIVERELARGEHHDLKVEGEELGDRLSPFHPRDLDVLAGEVGGLEPHLDTIFRHLRRTAKQSAVVNSNPRREGPIAATRAWTRAPRP